jgi:ABC-type multidrug transport system fused ATPase/permease subunit
MLEKGRIIEEGTYKELLARNGKYAKMWAAQAVNMRTVKINN